MWRPLRMAIVSVVLAGLVSSMTPISTRAADPMVVFPTGDASADVANIQAAIDASSPGDTIVLKAADRSGRATAFDFGPSSTAGRWVTIHADIQLVGEVTSAGTSTIRGGWGPITIENGANATVSGLAFDCPFQVAIQAFFAGNIRVVGNRIEHVVGRLNSLGVTSATAIEVGFSEGDVVINDNVIDDVDAAFGEGIGEFGASGRVEVARNRVTGVNLAGIEVTSYTFLPGQGASIHDNYVRPGPARYARGSAGTGIEINGHGSYIVERNEVICENPNAACIFAFGFNSFGFGSVDGARIAHNNITLDTGPFGAIGVGLIGIVPRAFVAHNKVVGTGFSAVATFGCGCEPASLVDAATFLGNEIATMRSGVADVFLDEPTRNATVVGHSGTVVDLGTGDLITGLRPVGGGGASVGKRLSDALADQRAAQAGGFAAERGRARTR